MRATLILLVWCTVVLSKFSHKQLGMECDRKGDLDCAIREFKEGIDLEPQDATGWNNYAVAMMRKYTPMRKMNKAKLLEVKGAYETSLALVAEEGTKKNLRGFLGFLRESGQFSEAELKSVYLPSLTDDSPAPREQAPAKRKSSPYRAPIVKQSREEVAHDMERHWSAGDYSSAVQLCSKSSATVTIPSAEFAAGSLSTDTLLYASRILRVCGVVILNNVYNLTVIEKLHKRQKAQVSSYLRKIADDPSLTNTTESAQRSPLRYEIKLPVKAPFTNEEFLQNKLLTTLVKHSIGKRYEIDTFSSVTSLPNSPDQHWHADTGMLFESFTEHTPTHGLVAFVPLVNVSVTLGPTEFLFGSHINCRKETKVERQLSGGWNVLVCPHSGGEVLSDAPAGSVILFDVRIMHRGTRNVQDQRRPMLYLTFFREWYIDRVNFNDRQTRDFDRYSPALRKLLTRVDTAAYVQLLEKELADRGVNVAEIQSSYEYKKHEL